MPLVKKVNLPSLPPSDATHPQAMADAEAILEKKYPPKAVAYGRELSSYELEKDRRISVQGVVQPILNGFAVAHSMNVPGEAGHKFIEELARFGLELVDKLVAERK
jgi:hypothetical protein